MIVLALMQFVSLAGAFFLAAFGIYDAAVAWALLSVAISQAMK